MTKQTPGLKQALKQVQKLSNQMNAERIGDYKVALSASRAISGNLGNVVGRLERPMLKDVLRSQKALGTLTYGSKMTQRRVRADEARTVSRYGQALGAAVNSVYAPAQAVADSSVQMQRGAEIAGVKGGRAAQTVAALGRQGVAAGNAAARYALAQALQQRTIVDSGTIAQLTGQLYQSAIDYQNQWSLWKKQQDYLKKQADKEEAGGRAGLRAVAETLSEEAPSMGYEAWNIVNDHWDENTGQLDGDIKTLADDWANANGYAVGGPEHTVMLATIRNLKNQGNPADADTNAAINQAIAQLYRGTPGWERISSSIADTVASGTSAEFTRQRLMADVEAENQGVSLYPDPANTGNSLGYDRFGSVREGESSPSSLPAGIGMGPNGPVLTKPYDQLSAEGKKWWDNWVKAATP